MCIGHRTLHEPFGEELVLHNLFVLYYDPSSFDVSKLLTNN